MVAACTHRGCVRALFSATLPETVEQLARSVLQDPLRVTVGERNTGGWFSRWLQLLLRGVWQVLGRMLCGEPCY